MQLDQAVMTFGRAMRERHGVNVHKLSVNAGFTCPNRDGTRGVGGCTFCNNRSFSPSADRRSVREQLLNGQQTLPRARPGDAFLAYFQSYTNTYDEVDRLEVLYREALAVPGVIGLSVGTRPDCVPDRVLDLLATLRDEGHEVWLELGLQSAFDETLARINRGHDFAEYVDATRRARARQLQVCSHLILGLPGEDEQQWMISLLRVLSVGTDGLKLHPLHVVRNTQLANDWRAGRYQPITRQRYTDAVARMLLVIPPKMVLHRLTGTAGPDTLLAPAWCGRKWPVLNEITHRYQQLLATQAWPGPA